MDHRHIGVLDGWRGAAILLVLASHYVPGLGIDAPLNTGRLGVELFFALSGTLVGRMLLVQQMPLPDYALRRFARIVPSMWLVIAVVAPFAGLPWSSLARDLVGLANTAANPVVLEHLWSVAVELQGYALLGVAAWTCRRWRLPPGRVLAAVIAGVWLLLAVRAAFGPLDYYAVFWRFPYRLTAMVAAAALVSSAGARRACGRHAPWLLVAGLALQWDGVPDGFKYTLGSLSLAGACVGAAEGGLPIRLQALLRLPVMRAFGAASYSLYLWQQLFYAWTGPPWPLRLAGALLLGFTASRLWDGPLHHGVRALLERRLARWLRPVTPARRPPRAPRPAPATDRGR